MSKQTVPRELRAKKEPYKLSQNPDAIRKRVSKALKDTREQEGFHDLSAEEQQRRLIDAETGTRRETARTLPPETALGKKAVTKESRGLSQTSRAIRRREEWANMTPEQNLKLNRRKHRVREDNRRRGRIEGKNP